MTDYEIYQVVFSVHSLVIQTIVMAAGLVTLICLLIDRKDNKK